MDSKHNKLQSFEHNQTEYNRPGQKWQCGHLCDGESCYLGPSAGGMCQSSCECLPKKVGERWYCTRAESRGGECSSGPGTDGRCACQLATCQPRLSLRHYRGRLTIMLGLACLGLLLFFLGGDQERREHFVSPGALSSVHSSEQMDCAQCHTDGDGSGAIFTHAGAESSTCLRCHENEIGAGHGRGMAAHGVEKEMLAMLTARAASEEHTSADDPVLSLASAVFSERHRAGSALECSLCHHEHQGRGHDLTAMTNRQCQVCHQNQFKSFSDGHPNFDSKKYPYARRSRIVFDHQSHYQKHFKNESKNAPAGYDSKNPAGNPKTCFSCHQTDKRGEKMLVPSFEVSCGQCHGKSVTGGTPLSLFALPDLAGKAPHSHWPKSGLGLNPATRLLLSPVTQSALASLPRDSESGDIMLNESLHPELARNVSTGLTTAFDEIWNEGHLAITTRMRANGFGRGDGKVEGDELHRNLVAGLSLDTLRAQLFPGVKWQLAEFCFPELDLNRLNAQLAKSSNRSVGYWPRNASGPLSPLMTRLLSQDPALRKDLDTFKKEGGASLKNLEKANSRQIQAAENIAWGVKRIYQAVQLMGDPMLEQFVKLNGGIFHEDAQNLRGGIFFAAQSDLLFRKEWEREFARYRTGQWPAASHSPDTGKPAIPAENLKPDEDDDFGDDEEADDDFGDEEEEADDDFGDEEEEVDDDFGDEEEEEADDDFGDDDENTALPDKGPKSATTFFEPTSHLDWLGYGGWFQENSRISYASKGHADPVLKAWLETSLLALNSSKKETQQIGSDLLFYSFDYRHGVEAGSTGKCLKCHTIDRVIVKNHTQPQWRVNWNSNEGKVRMKPHLTRFRHDKHLSQMSCLACHKLNPEGKYKDSFPPKNIWARQNPGPLLKKLNPGQFTPNFFPLHHLNDCARCHNPQQAGDSCTQCHSYHALKR